MTSVVRTGFSHVRRRFMDKQRTRRPVTRRPQPAHQDRGSGKLTVREYLEEWLAGKQALKPSTRESYSIHIHRYLGPCLGELRLAELQPGHIERMYREINES